MPRLAPVMSIVRCVVVGRARQLGSVATLKRPVKPKLVYRSTIRMNRSKMAGMTIQILTPRLVLRTPSLDDLYGYLAYRNDDETLVSQMMAPSDEESAAAFLQNQSVLPDDAWGWRMMSVECRDNPGIIGEVGIFTSPDNLRQGDAGWWLHPDHRQKGYALEAVRALMGWCFANRGLHRITAHCLAANTASRRLMGRLGMRLECHSVESRWLDERWHDECAYAVLEREWENAEPPTIPIK